MSVVSVSQVPANESIDITVRLQPEQRTEHVDYDLSGGISVGYANGATQVGFILVEL